MPIHTQFSWRQAAISILLLLLLLPFNRRACAQEIAPDRVQVYALADSLKIDVGIDSLFSHRNLDAIESGMTASIAIHFRLIAGAGQRVGGTDIYKRLEHDIWEGTYRLIDQTDDPDTLMTTKFSEVEHACADLQGVFLAALPLPDDLLTLQARIVVNPITPEQQARTQRWLNILKKGTLLEFFFSLETPTNSQRWVNLLTFRPEAIPHLIRETRP